MTAPVVPSVDVPDEPDEEESPLVVAFDVVVVCFFESSTPRTTPTTIAATMNASAPTTCG